MGSSQLAWIISKSPNTVRIPYPITFLTWCNQHLAKLPTHEITIATHKNNSCIRSFMDISHTDNSHSLRRAIFYFICIRWLPCSSAKSCSTENNSSSNTHYISVPSQKSYTITIIINPSQYFRQSQIFSRKIALPISNISSNINDNHNGPFY